MLLSPEWEERELEELLRAKQSARDAYVSAWRERHWIWSERTWQCPLCNRVIQAIRDSDVMYMATQHQMEHGRDWLDYHAASDVPGRDAGGER